MNKHGIMTGNLHSSIEDIADTALQRRYSHIWHFADVARDAIPTSFGAYSIQVSERHKKVATVSVWKRGSGHVDIIFVNNTAWVEGASAFKGVTPAQLLDAVNYMERVLGITIAGSPGGAGWELLKKLHPEWIENIPVNLRDLHFTPKAGSDLIWQLTHYNYNLPYFKYVHKFDKGAAYPAAAADTDIGKGTPVHLEGEEANRASIHEKGHPQEVGVWRCTIEYSPLMYNSVIPPVWGEHLETFAGSEGWLAGPIIRMLRAFGHIVHVHEGNVFPERHDVLKKWATFLWDKRQECTNEIARKGFKQIANTTIGFTAFRHFDEDEEEKRRPDIRLQVVSRNREIMRHNIEKVWKIQNESPCMVYMDAVYYLSNAEDGRGAFPVLVEREGKLGGFRYEGRIELTPDVQAMFATKLNVVDRLEFLNKIGWVQ